MNYIINVVLNLKFISLLIRFFRRLKKRQTLILNIGHFKYSLSDVIILDRTISGIRALHSLKWKKRRGKALIIPSTESNPHIVIFGMSGQGKSTLLRSIIIDINSAGKPAIIFDAHDEHEEIVKSLGGRIIDSMHSGINIFSLDGSTVGERISELSSLFKGVYSLGYIQSLKLAECMWYTYRKCGASSRNDMELQKLPTITDVLNELNIFIKNSITSAEKNSLMHLRSKFSSLALQPLSGGNFDIESLQSGITSFSLAHIRSAEAQIIYINELLRRLYITMKTKEREKGVNLYIILDEAQFIINDSDSQIVKRLTEEGRKYGVGMILATHMASKLSKEIVANASTFITFYPREPHEINYIANLLSSGISNRALEVKKMLNKLRKNEAMLLSYNIREPSVVKTTKPEIISKHIKLSGAKPTPYLYPLKPVKVRNFKGAQNNLQKISLNWKGKEEHWVMRKNSSLSIEHEVCVKKIFEELSHHNIKTVIINNSNGPDVVAYGKHGKIAIEYETGKKSIKSTAKMLKRRQKSFKTLIVVVNEKAFKFYHSYFETGKVKVISFNHISKLPLLLRQATQP